MPVPRDVAEKVFEDILTENFIELFLHLTMELMQKLMDMMQGPRPQMQIAEFIEPLQLRKTKITIKDMSVIYKTPPMTLTTQWVYKDDNFRIRDFAYKPNWFWVLLHYNTMKQVKQKMETAKAEAVAAEAEAQRLAQSNRQTKVKAEAANDAGLENDSAQKKG